MEQLQRFLSTVVIVSLYNVGLLLRFLVVHLLNIVIYARFRHAASEKQLIAPLVPADLVLEKRNNHIGVCLKKIKFDQTCPLAYRSFKISPHLSVVMHLKELNNVWLGFSRCAKNKISISVGSVSVDYHLITKRNSHEFSFIQQVPILQDESLESVSDLTDEFIQNSISIKIDDNDEPTKTKSLVSVDVQQGIGRLLVNLIKTIAIDFEKISIFQRDSIEKSLNFTTNHLSYEHEEGAFVVRLADFIVEFVENGEKKKDLLLAHFTESLMLSVDESIQVIRLTFENETGQVDAKLAGNAPSELIMWFANYNQDSLVQKEPITKTNSMAKSNKPLRIEVAFSAQVFVTTLENNKFRWCLSDLHICFDNIIDSNRIITRIGNVFVEIKQSNDVATKFFVGLIECNLTRTECDILLCEETTLALNNVPLVHVCDNVLLHYDFADCLWIVLKNQIETHLRVSGSAMLISQLVEHLSSVTRDLLDTLMPNRLFIPGLSEARKEFHQRTDKPLSAEKLAKRQNNLPLQTALLCSLMLAPDVTCRIEIKLHTSQTLTSHSVLTADITALEACFYALPSSLSQFCEPNLTSSLAIDIENIALHDSVVGSHWRYALQSKTPLEIRYIQKTAYLPVLRCDKKLGFYNNGEKIRIDAHLHEVFLRFMIDYCREIISKDAKKESKGEEESLDAIYWSLRLAPLTVVVSYKPSTSHGSVVNSTFLETGVPNISLSNASVSFKTYQSNCLHRSLGAAMSDYFSCCFPQIESLLLSASKALPIIQPIVQTATELASDLTNSDRTWKQTAARVTSNVVYSGTKLSVAAFKVARSTDRWLAKKQKSHVKNISMPQTDRLRFDDHSPLPVFDEPEQTDEEAEKNLKGATVKKISSTKIQYDNISIYANQPRTLNRALSDGATILQENAKIAFSALVTEPKKAFKYGSWQSGAAAALYGLPRAITRSATGLTGATVKLGHGLSNAIDEEKYNQRHHKWKSESYTK